MGAAAGASLTTGTFNTFIGPQGQIAGGSGGLMTTGSENTILGAYNGNQGGLDITTANNYIVLSDGDGNPRGVFDNNGQFLVAGSGSQPTSTNVGAMLSPNPVTVNPSKFSCGTATGSITQIQFINGNGAVGSISTSGSSTSFNVSSYYRLKNTIAPMTGALAKVAQLKPVSYKWNADGSDGQGFIAHELAEVVPDCVTGEKDAVDSEGKPQYQGVDTSFLVATLTAAIQELKAEFDAYKASHP